MLRHCDRLFHLSKVEKKIESGGLHVLNLMNDKFTWNTAYLPKKTFLFPKNRQFSSHVDINISIVIFCLLGDRWNKEKCRLNVVEKSKRLGVIRFFNIDFSGRIFENWDDLIWERLKFGVFSPRKFNFFGIFRPGDGIFLNFESLFLGISILKLLLKDWVLLDLL